MEENKYSTIDETYCGVRLGDILEILPGAKGISTYFSGMFNYCPAMPKSNIHANDYYLYVKVFNIYFKDNQKIETIFSETIEYLLSKNNLLDVYISFEVLVNQLVLTNNKENSFDTDKTKMINWFERIMSFFRNTSELEKIEYGIAKMYPNGLKDVINSYADIIRDKYNINARV